MRNGRKQFGWVWAAASAVMVAGSALGQAGPATGPGGTNGVPGGVGAAPTVQVTPLPTPALPTDSISNTPGAIAVAQASRTRLQNVRDDLSDYVRLQRFVFDNSPEVRKAVEDHRAAYETWLGARKAALASLEHDAQYVEARRIREATGFQLEAERAKPTPDAQRLASLSGYRLSLARQMTLRESAVLANDKNFLEARSALVEAGQRIDAARREFEVKLRTSPELATARRDYRSAAEQQAYAMAYAEANKQLAQRILQYAYFTQLIARLRPYVITSPYYGGGYYGGGYYGGGYYGYNQGLVAPVATPANNGGIGYGLLPGQ